MNTRKTKLIKAGVWVRWLYHAEPLAEEPDVPVRRRAAVGWILKSENLPLEPEESHAPLGARLREIWATEELPLEGAEASGSEGFLKRLLAREKLPEDPMDQRSILSFLGWLLKPERLVETKESRGEKDSGSE